MSQALLTGSFALRQHIHKHLAKRTTRYLTRTMVREAHFYIRMASYLLILREAARQSAYRPNESHPCMQAMASQGSKYYCLQYKYVADIMEKRGPHRDAHLGAAKKKVCLSSLQCCMHTQQLLCQLQLSTDFTVPLLTLSNMSGVPGRSWQTADCWSNWGPGEWGLVYFQECKQRGCHHILFISTVSALLSYSHILLCLQLKSLLHSCQTAVSCLCR